MLSMRAFSLNYNVIEFPQCFSFSVSVINTYLLLLINLPHGAALLRRHSVGGGP